jgi:menaquinone-dependent protoporphyrinogen oxidase
VLADHGLDTAVIPPEQVGAIDDFDAAVLGSAVYMGQWMKPARELADRSGEALAALPVWLFSSGPVGDPPKPAEAPVDVAEILQATKARDHRVFAGKLVKKQLSEPWPWPFEPRRATSGTGTRSGRGRLGSPTLW